MMGWCPNDGEECRHDGWCNDCEHARHKGSIRIEETRRSCNCCGSEVDVCEIVFTNGLGQGISVALCKGCANSFSDALCRFLADKHTDAIIDYAMKKKAERIKR